LGTTIGLVAGGLTFAILRARRRRAGLAPAIDNRNSIATTVGAPLSVGGCSPGDAAIAAAIEVARRRYDGLHPRFKWYARMKYVMDPCYRAIAPRVPEGAFLVDLGSGLGMLPVLVGVLGGGRRALGVEWDAAKVACGVHAARGLPSIEVVAGDARSFAIPPCDVVTLVDMLHYWDGDTQRALLSRCRAALRPGGRLLVREGDPARRGGARFTRVAERLVTRLGWNRGPDVHFRPVADLRADLESLGFTVTLDEVAARTHPGNVLFVCDLP
jgi:SAM-dependent methyltransferase